MKTICATAFLLMMMWGAWASQEPKDKPPMVTPKVTHHDEQSVQHYDRVEITCPEGYEGHFVDVQLGFEPRMPSISFGGEYGGGELKYVVCFSKEFMDKLRANPEMLKLQQTIRPV